MDDLTDREFEFLCTKQGQCIYCGAGLLEGPHGGMSVNYYCKNDEHCGARYNVMGPLGAQMIRESKWEGERACDASVKNGTRRSVTQRSPSIRRLVSRVLDVMSR